MKRKIALLVATVMTVSAVPTAVFASSSNSLTTGTLTVPSKTILMEEGTYKSGSDVKNNSDVEYVTEGETLKIVLKDGAQAGDQFKVNLTNAKWYFRSTQEVTDPTGGLPTTTSGAALTPGTSAVATQALPSNFTELTDETATYDTSKGIYISDSSSSKSGTYYRAADSKNDVPYALTVSPVNDQMATITIMEDVPEDAEILIPLVVRTTGSEDVQVQIVDSGSKIVTNSTLYLTTQSTGGKTKTYSTNSKDVFNEQIEIESLVIAESSAGAITPGKFEIKAPTGYYFEVSSKTELRAEPGITFGADDHTTAIKGEDYTMELNDNSDVITVTLMDPAKTTGGAGINKSAGNSGSLYFTGITLVSDDNTSYGKPVYISIKDTDSKYDPVTSQTDIQVGIHEDYNTMINTTTEIPTLQSGVYTTAEDKNDEQQTAHIKFEENMANSWNSMKTTTFTLPEGVKVSAVEITDTKNIENDIEGTYYNTNKKTNGVTVDDNIIEVQGLTKIDSDEEAGFEMDLWLSIEPGYTGDIVMDVETDSTTNNKNDDEIPGIVVAKAYSPITISTSVTNVKVGLQEVPTADIIIKENEAGALEKGKVLNLHVTDFNGVDMEFNPGATIEVTEGDLEVKKVSKSSTNSSRDSLDNSSLSMQITKTSTKPSTIKISNASLKVPNNVPSSNGRPYDVVATGSAVGENYGYTTGSSMDEFGAGEDWDRNYFETTLIKAPYVTVGSTSMTSEIRMTEGQNYYTVDGEKVAMDAAAYISPESESMMVPLRFVSNAFGIPDSNILWDDPSDTVTIISYDGTILQFTAGSSQMLVNGVAVPMLNEKGNPVKAEMHGETSMDSRMYLPFRAVGQAFGVPVSWDEATRTAIYNEKKATTTTTTK